MQALFLFIIFIRASLDYFANISIMGLNPSSYLAVLIVLMFFLELFSRTKLRIEKDNSMFGFFSVYLLLLFPSVVLSNNIGSSVVEFIRYLSELGCIYLAYKYCKKNPSYIQKLVTAMLLSSIVPLSVGFYQLLTHGGVYDRQVGGNRVISVFVHENQFAIYLVVIITLCLLIVTGKILSPSNRYKRFVYLVLVGSLINLLFTYSRTCWVWLAIIVFGIGVFSIRKKSMILLVGVALVGAYFASDIVLGRFLDVSRSGTGGSLTIRQAIVASMFNAALKKPLFGHGLGNFSEGTVLYMNRTIEAHNEYIKTFFDSGAFGVIGLIYYFFNLFKCFIRRGIRENHIIVFFIVGFYIACYFTNTLSCLVGQIYLLTMLTMMLQTNQNQAKQRKEN